MFFNDRWCTYPDVDFNELFRNMGAGLDIRLNVDIVEVELDIPRVVDRDGTVWSGDYLISTLSIDRLLSSRLGRLAYTGYTIEPRVMECEWFHSVDRDGQHVGMVYYPSSEIPYCRTTEYKAFINKHASAAYSGRTIVTFEYPSSSARFYPFDNDESRARLSGYVAALSSLPRCVSLGRMGLFRYTTIDTTTEQVFRFISHAGRDLEDWRRLTQTDRQQAYWHIRGRFDN